MSMMTLDGVFQASSGNDVDGERHEGHEAVRAAYAAVFAQYPDAHWAHARHFASGERGVSEWTFSGTLTDGRRVEVNGPGGTGSSVRISGYEEWTLGSDGLISQSKGHFDHSEYQRQLTSGPPAVP